MNKLLCIGDSITAGWPYGTAYAYSEYLKTDHTVVNRGVPGEASRDILRRFERELISSGANTVLIMAGTNDAMSPNGSVETALQCMQQMIRTAHERNVLPVVLTCMIPDQQGVPAWFDDHERVRKFLEQYDQMLTEYCRNEQICLISTHTLTPGYADGVHPDKEGYRILGEYISREVRNLLSLQQNRPEDLTI
jgi:lysophospholipase L1-like esterase